MNFYFIFYFLVGVLQDFLLTLNWRFVSKDKPWRASLFSFLTAVMSLAVFYNILTKLDSEKSLMAIIIYSFGIGTGTFVAMKFKNFGLKEK